MKERKRTPDKCHLQIEVAHVRSGFVEYETRTACGRDLWTHTVTTETLEDTDCTMCLVWAKHHTKETTT